MKIQIMKIYNESFQNVRSHKIAWIRVAYAPLVIWALGALFLAFSYMHGGHSFEMQKVFLGSVVEESGESSALPLLGQFLYQITYYIAITSLTINGYRYALFQEGGQNWITLNLNMRFVRMFLYSLLIGVLAGVFLLVSAGIIFGFHALLESMAADVILGALLVIFGFYLMFRIILYPVAISIDQGGAIRTSWRMMKGNIFRLLGLFILIGLTILLIGVVLGIIVWLLTAAFAMGGPVLFTLSVILWVVFGLFMFILSWSVNAKALGLVYQELAEKKAALPKEKAV